MTDATGTTVAATPHPWSKDALLTKAQRYSEEMFSHAADEWKFAFWSTLTLELLARAALSNVSPTLLSEAKDFDNLYFSLGFTPKTKNFVPKSIDITSVAKRLNLSITDFREDLMNFTIRHMGNRNEEVHSGSTPFEGGNSTWLPDFYVTSDVLLVSMGENLESFLGNEAITARKLIAAASDESSKTVLAHIGKQTHYWVNLEGTEQENRIQLSNIWANRTDGHRVQCPACNCQALIYGEPAGPPNKKFHEGEIIEIQQYIPVKFECIACRLKIYGLPQLMTAKIGNTYTAIFSYEPYGSDEEYEYEPDYND